MGRVIARVFYLRNPEKALFVVGYVICASLVITALSRAIVGVFLLMSMTMPILPTMILDEVVVVTFTEDGLVIGRGGRRGRVFIPKSVVITGNVICIRRESRELSLRVTYESFDYTIPLSQRQYDRLVNGLTTHWGWIPPECPEQLIQAR
jgi:uncharacterized membrane protein